MFITPTKAITSVQALPVSYGPRSVIRHAQNDDDFQYAHERVPTLLASSQGLAMYKATLLGSNYDSQNKWQQGQQARCRNTPDICDATRPEHGRIAADRPEAVVRDRKQPLRITASQPLQVRLTVPHKLRPASREGNYVVSACSRTPHPTYANTRPTRTILKRCELARHPRSNAQVLQVASNQERALQQDTLPPNINKFLVPVDVWELKRIRKTSSLCSLTYGMASLTVRPQ